MEILEKIKNFFRKNKIVSIFLTGAFLIICFSVLSFSAGILAEKFQPDFSKITFLEPLKSYLDKITSKPIETQESEINEYVPQTTQEQAVIKVVKDYSPAVVSIIVTKDLPVIEEYYVSPFEGFFNDPFFEFQIPQYRQNGTEKKEIGGGSGFIVSEDGVVITNKHVVLDAEADYTVLTTDGRKFPAKVLAKDPAQDLAVLKIEKEKVTDADGNFSFKPFPVVKLGDSSKIEIGQSVIAIGNALGEYRNTISVGQVFEVLSKLSGSHIETKHLSQEKVLISYNLPLREVITNLYENIKNVTSGFASMDYQMSEYKIAELVKLDILIAGKKIEAFAKIVPEQIAYQEGKKQVERLKQTMPRQLFSVPLQAAIGAKIIARETLSAKGKDVTAPLYGGDYTRKLKLLQKQKKGKKELKEKGQLHIPQKVFIEMLRG